MINPYRGTLFKRSLSGQERYYESKLRQQYDQPRSQIVTNKRMAPGDWDTED